MSHFASDKLALKFHELQEGAAQQRDQLALLGQRVVDFARNRQPWQRWTAAYALGLVAAGTFTALEYFDVAPSFSISLGPVCMPGNTQTVRPSDDLSEVTITSDCYKFQSDVGLLAVKKVQLYAVNQGLADRRHALREDVILDGTLAVAVEDSHIPGRPSFLTVAFHSPHQDYIESLQRYYETSIPSSTVPPNG